MAKEEKDARAARWFLRSPGSWSPDGAWIFPTEEEIWGPKELWDLKEESDPYEVIINTLRKSAWYRKHCVIDDELLPFPGICT